MNNIGKPETRLKEYYAINFEIGLICALTVFIIVFRTGSKGIYDGTVLESQYVVATNEFIEKKHFSEIIAEPVLEEKKAVTPPPPEVPIVQVEEIVEEIIPDFHIGESLPLETDQLVVPLPSIEEELDYYLAAQEMPDLLNSLLSFHRKVVYPEKAREKGIEGRVFLQFIVNENGEVEDPVVLRGIGGGCDEAAIRAVKQAQFSPGYVHGEPARVKVGMAVRFELNRLTGLPERMLRERDVFRVRN